MKGVIVAAGYGTRFLPVTKTVPKEMLPLVDTPSIDFIAREFIASGITQILVITSRRKRALEDYFDREMELESVFRAENAEAKLEKIAPPEAEVTFVRQTEMRGTGHALLAARTFAGNEPVVVAYPDDLHFGEEPLAAQLIEAYRETGCSVLATLHDPPDLHRYGVLDVAEDGLHVRDIVEKPKPGTEPSREASIGRYLYTPDFFGYLESGWDEHVAAGRRREYYHIDALKSLMDDDRMVFVRTRGERIDTGAPEGYLRAIARYAAGVPSYLEALRAELARLEGG
jgi:UTP--glucose-1-phosphate uridylyltransferase